MQLLASWKQSLSIFYPLNNLKLFGFAILRAAQVAVPQFLKSFWWLYLVMLLGVFMGMPVIDMILSPLSTVCIYLAVRPSVGLKNKDYWLAHWKHIVFGVALSWVLALATGALASAETLFCIELPLITNLSWLIIFCDVIVFNIIFAALPLWYFFFLDSHSTIFAFGKAWKNAFVMAWYTLPVWLIFYVGLELMLNIFEMINVVENWVTIPLMILLSVILQIVAACVWSVFYTKRLHEQFEIYFPGPQIKE